MSFYYIALATVTCFTCFCLASSLEIRSRAGIIDRLHARRVARQLPAENHDDEETINMEFGAADDHQAEHANHASSTTPSEFDGAEEARLEYRGVEADSSSTTAPQQHLAGLEQQHGDEMTVSEQVETTTEDDQEDGGILSKDEIVVEPAGDEDAQIHTKDEVETIDAESNVQTRDEVTDYVLEQSAGHGHARAGWNQESACDNWPCHNGSCIVDMSYEGFTCNCNYGFKGKYCDVYDPEEFAWLLNTTTRTTATTRGWGPPPNHPYDPQNPHDQQDQPGYLRSDDAVVQRVSACLVVMATGLLLARHL
jgi:hypothetical protein